MTTDLFGWIEIRLGLRWMRKQPLVTATAVVALAVGIGLATVGATVFEATLFAALPRPS